MILESPIYGQLDLQTYNGSTWESWIGSTQKIDIQRGGERTQVSQTVEVGTLNCTLVNAGDPMTDPRLRPNVPIRLKAADIPQGHYVPGPDIITVPAHDVQHPEVGHWAPGPDVVTVPAHDVSHPVEVLETNSFNTSSVEGWDNWSYIGDATSVPFTEDGALKVTAGPDQIGQPSLVAAKVVTGLTIGAFYTIGLDVFMPAGWAYGALLWNDATFGNSGSVDFDTAAAGMWQHVEMDFMATSSEFAFMVGCLHEDDVTVTEGDYFLMDNTQFVRDSYTETVPDQYGPGPDIWVVDQAAWVEHVPAVYGPGPDVWVADASLPGAIIWTGVISDIETDYDIDKSGDSVAYVHVSAVDAVSAHKANTRYGAVTDGGVGYERWAARINRLAASSTTPINPPGDDTPIVRYAV